MVVSFCGRGQLVFPLCPLKHIRTHTLTHTPFHFLCDDLGLTRKWMVWANELRCLKVQCKNIAFGIPMSFFFWGFFSFVVCRCFFLLFFIYFFPMFGWSFMCVCARVLRLYFFVALIEVKRYLFSGLTQQREKTLFRSVDTYNLHCGLSHDRHFDGKGAKRNEKRQKRVIW